MGLGPRPEKRLHPRAPRHQRLSLAAPPKEPDRVVITGDNAGRRLDVFVRQLVSEVALGTVMKWLRRGTIRLNGSKARPNARLQQGDLVTLPAGLLAAGAQTRAAASLPSRVSASLQQPLPLPEILFEDDDLLVVAKPAGLAVHGGSGHEQDSLMARICAYLGPVTSEPGRRPGLVQRLDRDVSGVLVVGKNAPALKALNAAVRDHAIDKRYVALACGVVAADEGHIDIPLLVERDPPRDAPRTRAAPASGLAATTDYRLLQRFAQATLLEVRIHTGHQHQIRAHLSAIGHPLVGDRRYGGSATAHPEAPALRRPFLHAARVTLAHPRSGKELCFSTPLTPELAAVLQRLMALSPALLPPSSPPEVPARTATLAEILAELSTDRGER